jgi:pimeloyl-ACP methyl ester carboxylesterase
MPFVHANGQRLFYEERGAGEPLLLVMGIGGDHLAWALQVREFARGFRTISFDNRDVGQSSTADGEYDVADLAADTIALADALGLERFHLLGISMGGAVAQEVALSARERVLTLTLCMTWGGSGAYGAARAETLARTAHLLDREEHIDQMLGFCLTERAYARPGVVDALKRMMRDNPQPQSMDSFARQARATGRHETRSRLGSLALPVHVIGAEQDVLVPVWKSRELADLIPGAELTVIEGQAHAANLEDPKGFNATVLGFLRAHAAERTTDAAA